MAGTIVVGAVNCTLVITPDSASHPITANNGYACAMWDQTHPTILIGGNSSSTTQTASFTIPAGASVNDVMAFQCMAY